MRPIRVVVPFKLEGAKSRLSSILSPQERRLLALTMLGDVLTAVGSVGDITVLSRSPMPPISSSLPPFEVVVCPRELDSALNSYIGYQARLGWPVDLLIAMADLPLMRPRDVKGLLATPGDVVMVPGRGGGTNLILVRDSKFRVNYYGLSFLKHRRFAEEAGLSATVFESYRGGCDLDEPSDLVEVLIHGLGETPRLLAELGFGLSCVAEKRVGCVRDDLGGLQ